MRSTLKKAFVLGSGGMAKDAFLTLRDSIDYQRYEFVGYIERDDFQGVKSRNVFYESDFLKKFAPSENVSLFLGVGSPEVNTKLINKFGDFDFPNLIHRDVKLDESIKLGKGNIFSRGVNFSMDIIVGSFNIFNALSTIGHDVNIGNCNVFNPLSNIAGGVQIGNCNLFGSSSTVLQYLKIGNENTVGAGGLVTKEISDNGTYVGVPCKKIK